MDHALVYVHQHVQNNVKVVVIIAVLEVAIVDVRVVVAMAVKEVAKVGAESSALEDVEAIVVAVVEHLVIQNV